MAAPVPVPYSGLKDYTYYIVPTPSDEARFLTATFATNADEYLKEQRRLLFNYAGRKMYAMYKNHGAWYALLRNDTKGQSVYFDETSFPAGQMFQEVGWDWKPIVIRPPYSYRERKKGDPGLEIPEFVGSITLLMRNFLCTVKTSDGTVSGIGKEYVNRQMDVSKWDENRRLGLLYEEADTKKLVGAILYDYDVRKQIVDDGVAKTVVYRKLICGKGVGELINTYFEASIVKQTQDARLPGIEHVLIVLAATENTVPLHEKVGYTLKSSEPDGRTHYMSKTIAVPPLPSGGRRARRRTARVLSRHTRKSRLTRKKRLHPPGIGPG